MQSSFEIIELDGNLMARGSEQLIDTINQRMRSGISTVLLDLSLARFADSSGLATLVRIYKTAQKSGIKICLCSVQAQVAFLFELTSMQKTFEVFENRQTFYQSWTQQFPQDALVPALETYPVLRVVTP